MTWAGFWAWVTDVVVRLWGWYSSRPAAMPSTEAASPVTEEKVEEVCETIEESELWRAVQSREDGLKERSLL